MRFRRPRFCASRSMNSGKSSRSRGEGRVVSPPKPSMRSGRYIEKPTRGCSPSLTMSMPALSWASRTPATAVSHSRCRACSSIRSPASWRSSKSDNCGGRGRLPQWVVRMRSRLVSTVSVLLDVGGFDDVFVELELLAEECVELGRRRADRLDLDVGVALCGDRVLHRLVNLGGHAIDDRLR